MRVPFLLVLVAAPVIPYVRRADNPGAVVANVPSVEVPTPFPLERERGVRVPRREESPCRERPRLEVEQLGGLSPNLIETPAGRDTLRPLHENVPTSRAVGEFVSSLDEKPLGFPVSPAASLHPQERPSAFELSSLETEFELTLPEPFHGVAVLPPVAGIPEENGARAVASLGNDSLEVRVIEGVILDLDGEPLLAWIEAGTLRNGPAQKDAVQLETEVVVETRGVMLVHYEQMPACLGFRTFFLAGQVSTYPPRLKN